MNLYGYVEGNPVNKIDRLGLFDDTITPAVLGWTFRALVTFFGVKATNETADAIKDSTSKECENPCKSLPACSQLRARGFKHENRVSALNEAKMYHGLKNISLHNDLPKHEINNPELQSHVNVRYRGRKKGTIISANCCESNTPKELWMFIPY